MITVRLLLVALPCLTASAADDFLESLKTKPRSWQTKSGASIKAVVQELGKQTVKFELGDGEVRAVPVENLIPSDERIVRVAHFGEQDDRQLQSAKGLVSLIGSDPEKTIDVLKPYHLDFPDSPYAGVWSAVCLSVAVNKHQEALVLLRQAANRIDRQREYDPTRHHMTEASLLNNMAICMLKDHKSDAAAGLLSQCLQSMPRGLDVFRHNAEHLLRVGNIPNTPLTLTDNSRRRLERSLQSAPPSAGLLPQAWFYSLDVDLPRSEPGEPPWKGIEPPKLGMQASHLRTGLAISESIVIASASGLGIDSSSSQVSISLIGTDATGNSFTAPADLVKIDTSANLVALQSRKIELKPVLLARPAIASLQVAVLSHAIRNRDIERARVRPQLGKLSAPESDSLMPSLRVDGSGDGPVFDRDYQLIGFAHRDEQRETAALTVAPDLLAFANEFLRSAKPTRHSNDYERARSACILIVRWQAANSGATRFYSQLPGIQPQSMRVPDPWCLRCKGIGFVDCQFGNCNRGMVVVRKRAQVGVNGVTGEPMYGNKNFRQACPKCSGRGGFDCPYCQHGKVGR